MTESYTMYVVRSTIGDSYGRYLDFRDGTIETHQYPINADLFTTYKEAEQMSRCWGDCEIVEFKITLREVKTKNNF